MISLHNLSIPKKIVAIIMIISGSALLLTTGALIAYDFSAARRDQRDSATIFASIVADNTVAAVSFNDQAAAVDTLHSLRAEPSIVASCIYTAAGLFAQHVKAGQAECPNQPEFETTDPRYIRVSVPIRLNGKEIGTIQLRASLEPTYARLRLEIGIIVAILVVAGIFAFALSARLHRFISRPILDLAKTAHEVSRRKDYSVRASKQNNDELGQLVDAFNEMLSRIEEREADLQERASELVQASRMKDEFLATLSHELRTPLNAILGWAVLVQQGQLTSDRKRSALESIERNARAQARLIEDLLDVSRIVSGKFQLDLSEVVLKQVVESAIEVVRPAAEAKKIRIQFERSSESSRVTGDPARLQQVVWNLLSNAVKFTGEHGSVMVRLEKNDRCARISVSDNGVGIVREFLPYVFDRFRQADGSSTRTQGGLGLGLAIVRHIAELHGGSVRVESKGKGQGSTFTIELPVRISHKVQEKRAV